MIFVSGINYKVGDHISVSVPQLPEAGTGNRDITFTLRDIHIEEVTHKDEELNIIQNNNNDTKIYNIKPDNNLKCQKNL